MTKEEKILIKFLKKLPLVLALPRTAECLALRKFKLKTPILDLGCGDGVFSETCFGKKAIDVGLDLDLSEIKIAEKSRIYKKVVRASASSMPFKDGHFKTVIANSVLEHIEGNLGPVLREINRVLEKGGTLILTVPRPVISNYLFFPRIFKNLKLDWLARAYIGLKQRLWKHHHLLEEQEWQKHLEKVGFEMRRSFTLIPKEAVAIHDIFYLLGFPYAIEKRLFGCNFVFRPRWLARFLAQKLAKYCQVFEGSEGTTLCIEAIKI